MTRRPDKTKWPNLWAVWTRWPDLRSWDLDGVYYGKRAAQSTTPQLRTDGQKVRIVRYVPKDPTPTDEVARLKAELASCKRDRAEDLRTMNIRNHDTVSTLLGALREIANHTHTHTAYLEAADTPTIAERQYQIGVTDGHRCAAEIARAALAQHGQRKGGE